MKQSLDTITSTLLEKLPLQGNHYYYILASDMYYPSLTILRDSLSSQPDLDTVLNTPTDRIKVCTCNGLGDASEEVLLSELLGEVPDTTNYVDVVFTHVYDCVPYWTEETESFQCDIEHIDKEIEIKLREKRLRLGVNFEEPGLILNITVDNKKYDL